MMSYPSGLYFAEAQQREGWPEGWQEGGRERERERQKERKTESTHKERTK